MNNPPDPSISPPKLLKQVQPYPSALVNPPQILVSPRARSPNPVPCSASASVATTPWPPDVLRVADTLFGDALPGDSGAEVSVVPPSSDDRLAQPSTVYDLLAPITPQSPNLWYPGLSAPSFTSASPFVWSFVVAEVDQPILGVDSSPPTTCSLIPGAGRLLHRPMTRSSLP
ncbi:hypothetical protein GWK47_000246 [Chionoecetes opilio]|uniref:Uncharacterized protein n=1 Tax=Chionoecetes opilio TaxID=41210 RepID=A0A8J8WEM1_CHIOP|nr:hypothetical protein GWK47_000246 [Chionoecetes opilio]